MSDMHVRHESHISDMNMWHGSFKCVILGNDAIAASAECGPWRLHCTGSCRSCMFMTWLIHVRGKTRSFVTWLIHVCDVTHSFLRLDLLVCETLNVYVWLIDVRDMTHSYVWHDSFTCVTWLIRFWDTTYTACVTWRIRSTHPSRWCKLTHFWTWLTHVRDMTNSCVTWLIHVCEMTFSFF